jgi:hypothetical protein
LPQQIILFLLLDDRLHMCTLGSVKGIEVELNEGGVAKYTGGFQLIIIPAG